MRIETGQGTISLITLISVMSISAIISLPGLAISPILGSLTKIFPHATYIEIEMLSSIPSLMIIPFIILSGYLSVGYNQIKILITGLLIYILSGTVCIFTNSMTMLIVMSTVLGVGAGMIIPLSTGFIARFFVGKYRTSQLGISSSIANFTLVGATLLAGWLAQIDWHLPFIVYLLPIITLIMSLFLDESKISLIKSHRLARYKNKVEDSNFDINSTKEYKVSNIVIATGKNYHVPALIGIMSLYFVAGYTAVTVVFNLPFVILSHNLSSSITGTLMSVFFLAITIPGLFMNRICSLIGHFSITVSMMIMGIGLTMIFLSQNVVLIGFGVTLVGLGYGFVQPFIYDKATQVTSSSKSIIALAYVMSVNYLTIVIAPFLINWLSTLFGDTSRATDAFIISAFIAFFVAIIATLRNRTFLFSV